MTTFQHEWAAPATELPDHRPNVYNELAELREAVNEFLSCDSAIAVCATYAQVLRYENAYNRLIALSAPRKPQEAPEIDPEPDEWYRTPSMLKEFPEPHIVRRSA